MLLKSTTARICKTCSKPLGRDQDNFCSRTCARTKHGAFDSPEYAVWEAMKQRCLNPKCKTYQHYGGRGIQVCERWRKFENFIADMGRRPSSEYTLDRENNNGNYEPGNCRWVTMQIQGSNRRVNHLITIDGKTATLTDWASKYNIDPRIIFGRIRSGWHPEQAVTTPVSKHGMSRHAARH
jgi:hypothetical protein